MYRVSSFGVVFSSIINTFRVENPSIFYIFIVDTVSFQVFLRRNRPVPYITLRICKHRRSSYTVFISPIVKSNPTFRFYHPMIIIRMVSFSNDLVKAPFPSWVKTLVCSSVFPLISVGIRQKFFS